MADTETERVALLSIHPEFAKAILDGSKRVEFRRVAPARSIEGVAIYATAPVRRVVGYFDVPMIESASPADLWVSWRRWAGISKPKYDEYFEGRSTGFAIHVGDVVPAKEPLELSDLDEHLRAPQSFLYLKQTARAQLESGLVSAQS